jgi:hypothetical protein
MNQSFTDSIKDNFHLNCILSSLPDTIYTVCTNTNTNTKFKTIVYNTECVIPFTQLASLLNYNELCNVLKCLDEQQDFLINKYKKGFIGIDTNELLVVFDNETRKNKYYNISYKFLFDYIPSNNSFRILCFQKQFKNSDKHLIIFPKAEMERKKSIPILLSYWVYYESIGILLHRKTLNNLTHTRLENFFCRISYFCKHKYKKVQLYF